MTEKDFLKYWLKSAGEDYSLAKDLIEQKKFTYCLFFIQLAIEKLIKGLIYKKTSEHALPIHNLIKLCQQANINLTEKQKDNLREITTWNIEARYDDIKQSFHKKANVDFTSTWFNTAEELYIWFKNQY